MDGFFLEALVFHKRHSKWVKHKIHHDAIKAGLFDVNSYFGLKLTWEDGCNRIRFFKRRHDTFKKITDNQEIDWNKEGGFISATSKTWTKIFEVKCAIFINTVIYFCVNPFIY